MPWMKKRPRKPKEEPRVKQSAPPTPLLKSTAAKAEEIATSITMKAQQEAEAEAERIIGQAKPEIQKIKRRAKIAAQKEAEAEAERIISQTKQEAEAKADEIIKQAKQEAEAKAEQEKKNFIDSAQRAERGRLKAIENAKAQAEEAECQRIVAAERAKREIIIAEECAERRLNELQRQKEADELAEQERQEADKRNVGAKRKAAKECIMAAGFTQEEAKRFVMCVHNGEIDNIYIKYYWGRVMKKSRSPEKIAYDRKVYAAKKLKKQIKENDTAKRLFS